MSVVVTVFSVTLTWRHVVVELRVPIVETGTSLMEIDCYSQWMLVISMNIVMLRELSFVIVTMLVGQLGSIVVLLLSMVTIYCKG